jgi:serine/threonine protein phosphatase 1
MWKLLPSRRQKEPARVPDGLRIYAIGDVHGRIDLLEQVLARIDADVAAHPHSRAIQVFLGDYIDRGPSSREVLDRLINRTITHEVVCLKGNHESYVMDFLKNPAILDEWRQYGGLGTLLSYGLAPSLNAGRTEQAKLAAELDRALPQSHRAFLINLMPSFTCGDFFFVHAGVRPGVPLPLQSEQDLLWIREDFLLCEDDFSKIVIHGHTPVLEPDVRSNRINIDTGAYATGQLTCLVLERDQMLFI